MQKATLEDEEPVQVDEDKVVDGGAHEDDDHAGDCTAPLSSKFIPIPPEQYILTDLV